MPGQALQVGPFLGGLNTFSDATAIADNEMSICENFELDIDGSLKSRPPFVNRDIFFPLDVAGGNVQILGYYIDGDAQYLLASDGQSSTYYFTGTSWTLITDTFAATSMCQFDHKAWMTASVDEASPGGYWTPAGGFTAVADMPHGDVVIAHKFRLWVVKGKDAETDGTRLYHSDTLGSTPFWPAAPDFIDIGSGDGQNIVSLTVYYNNLLILRTHSIYSLQYTTDPASGVVSLIVPGVGLADKNAMSLFENYLYFMYDDRAYEFSNSRSSNLNIKVPFEAGVRTGIYQPYAVSVFNQRVIFSFYDRLYVFGLKTRTWTIWLTAFGGIGKMIPSPAASESENTIAYSNSSVPLTPSRQATTLFLTDTFSEETEEMICRLETKNFNYEASSIYKRLFSWGVDATFRGTVTATAIPITFNYNVTWGQLRLGGVTWGSRRTGGFTWGQPTTDGLSIETVVDTSGVSNSRKFIKFKKSLRFRQIRYKLEFATDGSSVQAPVRVFSLMTYVKPKEKVSKQIT